MCRNRVTKMYTFLSPRGSIRLVLGPGEPSYPRGFSLAADRLLLHFHSHLCSVPSSCYMVVERSSSLLGMPPLWYFIDRQPKEAKLERRAVCSCEQVGPVPGLHGANMPPQDTKYPSRHAFGSVLWVGRLATTAAIITLPNWDPSRPHA